MWTGFLFSASFRTTEYSLPKVYSVLDFHGDKYCLFSYLTPPSSLQTHDLTLKVEPALDASGVISYSPVDNLDTLWLQFICGSHSYGSWAKMPTPISNGLLKSLLGYLKNNSVLIYQKLHLRLSSHLQTSSLVPHLLIYSLFLLCLFTNPTNTSRLHSRCSLLVPLGDDCR